jgi:predicted dehydrogenase
MGHSIHIHDMLTYLMGPVTHLFGRVATRVNPIETEDCVSATVQLKSGAFASLTATLGSQDQISRLRLAFENVTIESDHAPYAPGAREWKMVAASPKIEAEIKALLKDWVDVPPRFTTQIARFHDALMGRGPLPVSSADARQALEIVTAFYHSSKTHTEVRLPIAAGHPMYESWIPA